MSDSTKFQLVLEGLKFARDAGTTGNLPAATILASIREESAHVIKRIERENYNSRRERSRQRTAKLISQRHRLYRRVYEPGMEPTPLHALLVERIA